MSMAGVAITAFVTGVVCLFWGIYIGRGLGYVDRMLEELMEELKERER